MVMGRTDGSAGEDLPPGSSGLWEVEGDSAALPCRESAMQTDTPPAAVYKPLLSPEGDADASQPVCVPGC